MVKLLISVFIFAYTFCSVAGQCTLNPYRAGEITTPLINPTSKITFDELLLTQTTVEVPNDDQITWSLGDQSFILTGFFCGITKADFSMGLAFWNGGTPWSGESTGVGYYMFTESSDSVCTLTFNPPIAEFSMRVNTDSNGPGIIQVTTADNVLATCKTLSSVSGTNTWKDVGFRGSRQIKSVTLQGGYLTADNIEWKTGCSYGQTWNGQICEDLDTCTLDYCNTNAMCQEILNDPICTCISTYEGDGLGPNGCTDINECNLGGYCDEVANCDNYDGGYTCTCPDGYSGSGYIANGTLGDGCTANPPSFVPNPPLASPGAPPVMAPTSGPISGPTGATPISDTPSAGPTSTAPSGNTPQSAPSSSPQSSTPQSTQVSSAALLRAGLALLISAALVCC